MNPLNDDMNLCNQLLIAMPGMPESIFHKAVIYICEHTYTQGAIGLLVNKPMEFPLSFVFDQMKIAVTAAAAGNAPLLFGGPVQRDRGFVLHRELGAWRSSIDLSADIKITTSYDILESIAAGGAPAEFLVCLGHAGWGAGQLESEIADNVWLTCPASYELVFTTPFEQRWKAAAASLGVDINNLSADPGHA